MTLLLFMAGCLLGLANMFFWPNPISVAASGICWGVMVAAAIYEGWRFR